MVTHVPAGFAGELINGQLPLMLNDMYFVAGCPFFVGESPSPCLRVIWTTASVTKLIGGVPVLINTSLGISQSMSGVPQGMAIIASFQTIITD